MRYGHFDDEAKEYVIDRVDLPTSWTNYLGVENMVTVVNHTAGGYSFYKSPEYHRITRFRGNGVPMDRPGHYIYLRDNYTKDYWSVSWQPVGKNLSKAKYSCRHGMSYSVYSCDYDDIHATQKISIPIGDDVELIDVTIKNTGKTVKSLSVFSYLEFSFHHILMDNQNFQMSLYAAGSSFEDGIIEEDLFYEEFGYQYFTSSFDPDGFDCMRDTFLGTYGDEAHPEVVINGACHGSFEKGGNHCAALQKNVCLEPGEEVRYILMLGEGNRKVGALVRSKYSNTDAVDDAYEKLKKFWNDRFERLVINTPKQGMNSLINCWTLYQSEINVMFSRFASFIEVGGRVGLGYRDTAQDAMTIPAIDPANCKLRLIQLLKGLTSMGYGLHLFQPEWFEEKTSKAPFKSPTVVPGVNGASIIHGIEDACSDDALWLVMSVCEYIKETGDISFADEELTYADTFFWQNEDTNSNSETNLYGINAFGESIARKETVYEHLQRILDFSAKEIGATGICKGLRADWNDCLNLGGGESAMVSFLHYFALLQFISLSRFLGCFEDVRKYTELSVKVKKACNNALWDDGEEGDGWFIRGITKNGNKIGTHGDKEGRVHLESNSWAVLSGAADKEKAKQALNAIDEYLYTEYGIMLNTPAYTVPDDDIGFVTRVYPGLKENASVFSHPNPWAQAAACVLGRGDIAMKFYEALCPYDQNDKIEIRESEPYSYCQFVCGPDHTAFGRARHPFMTGSGGWSYYTATQYILGTRPMYNGLLLDPCVPKSWKEFAVKRVFRGATYNIHVTNSSGSMKGIKRVLVNGAELEGVMPPLEEEPYAAFDDKIFILPLMEKGSEINVEAFM